jgi:trehalose 6-phosphate synthase
LAYPAAERIRDLVGFQTENDATNFVRYLEGECHLQKLGSYTFQSGERTVRIGVFPIGIETNEFSRLARRSVRSPLVRNVLDSLAGRAMVIGVDRLDYSKGLAQRMDAFERFLAVYPDWRGKVTYQEPLRNPGIYRHGAHNQRSCRSDQR